MKKIIIFLTVVCIITTCFTISTFAAEDYTLQPGNYYLREDYEQYMNVTWTAFINYKLSSTSDDYNKFGVTDQGKFHFRTISGSNTNTNLFADGGYLIIETPQTVDATIYENFFNLFVEPAPAPTECDGTACPVGDANHDNYCDDCGLPMVYNLRSTLLDYAHSEIDRALTGSIPSGQYWLIVKTAPSYPGGPDSYYMYISAEKFYLDGNTLLAGTGNALVHRALVSQDSDGDFNASGWSSANTGSYILEVSDVVDSSHGTSFFFQIPLWMEMEQVGEQVLTVEAVPKVASVMTIVTASSVGLLALVIALILLSTKFRRFLP